MRRLSELSEKEILPIILNNQTLNRKFSEYIQESELDCYISEKLDCFSKGVDYSIGYYSHNYFAITDEWDFMEGISKSIRYYGGSTKLEKLYQQCKNLYGTNLYSYKLQQLCDLYFQEEIKSVLDYVEDLSYKIYCKDEDADYSCYLEIFIDRLDDYFIDEDGNIEHHRRIN